MSPNRQGYVLLDQARIQLVSLWFGGAGLIFLILVIQSIAGKYEGEASDVWGWALPGIMPTLSLILAVLGTGALKTSSKQVWVRSTFLSIAFWLSAGYLALILITILAEPLTKYDPIALYKLSSLWLAPLQGLVTASVGVVFFTKSE